MKKLIDESGYIIIDDVFSTDKIYELQENIIDFSNVFRRKIKVNNKACFRKIVSTKDLSDFLIWIDDYNNDYLFQFVELVGQLIKLKELTVSEEIIDLSTKLLEIPKNELLVGNASFLVNTPSSERLIYQWHNAKNYYPKRELHINFWIPLFIDKAKDNGTLFMAKGSHLTDYPFLEYKGPGDKSGKGSLTQNFIPNYYVDQFEVIPLECKVGSCAGILPRTIHTGSLNKSNECSYVLVFKIWANHKDWTLNNDLSIKYFSGDTGSGPDISII